MDASTVRVLVGGLFVIGPLVVVPLGSRLLPVPASHRAAILLRLVRWGAFPAGVALAIAFALVPGPLAGLLAVPWLAMAALGAGAALLDVRTAAARGRLLRPGPHHAVWAALIFLAVSAGHAIADRLGLQPFGFPPLIVLLTATHFLFAGFALVLVGALLAGPQPPRWLEAAVGAVLVGMPVTALGFFGVPPAALAGAWLVALGGLVIGVALVRSTATDTGSGAARVLRGVAGLALLTSMPLAALYAAGDVLGIPALDIPLMASTHGALNVLGFAVPAVVALTLDRRDSTAPAGGPGRAIAIHRAGPAAIVAAPIAGAVSLFLALTSLPLVVRVGFALAGAVAIAATAAAVLTAWRADR